MKNIKAPICPNCKKECSPSGGTVGGKKEDKAYYWTCWTCWYRVDDVPNLEKK